jgi:hypothetical protein
MGVGAAVGAAVGLAVVLTTSTMITGRSLVPSFRFTVLP